MKDYTNTRTTAELREAARIAASNCRWNRAADLMEAAIARYPEDIGGLRSKDLAAMKAQLTVWQTYSPDEDQDEDEMVANYGKYAVSDDYDIEDPGALIG